MSDEIDLANDRAALAVDAALRLAHDAALHPVVEATGLCLFCGEPLAAGLRWCDADCRDDWQRQRDR